MKKLLSVLFAAVLCFSAFPMLSGCTSRSQILKVANWGDYMDESVYKDFEQWYQNETGEKVKVEYIPFDTNESMFTLLKIDEADYDVICPSDYMAERMINGGYAKKLNANVIKAVDYVDPSLLKMTEAYDPTQEYTVPYMWGTYGIMYNSSKFEEGSIKSWDSLFTANTHNPGADGKDKRVYMKDSIRDVYSVGGIYASKQQLSTLSNGFTDYNENYKKRLQEIFLDVSTDAIASVEAVLTQQKRSFVAAYEVDDGKITMADAGQTAPYLGLFWSCDAGYVMNGYDSDGEKKPGSRELFYVVPEEGSNVWVDSFLIGKHAKNEKAANYFLKYLCQTDVARANMEFVGSSTPIKAVADQYKEELYAMNLTDNDSFFKGASQKWKDMYIEMMFPTDEVLDRCAIMHDFNNAEAAIQGMFNRVKGSN